MTKLALAHKPADTHRVSADRQIEFHTLTGTPEEISSQVGKKQKILAVVSTDDEALVALFQAFQAVTPSLGRLVREHQLKMLEDMFRVLLPPLATTPDKLKEVRMKVVARQTVLNSGEWLPAAEVSKLAGFSDTNPSTHPNKWKRTGQIFTINNAGSDFYPLYGLDPDQKFRPIKALKGVLEVLRADMDDWGIALWFASHNSYLDGQRPQDLLLSAPEKVLDAAREEVVGVTHG